MLTQLNPHNKRIAVVKLGSQGMLILLVVTQHLTPLRESRRNHREGCE